MKFALLMIFLSLVILLYFYFLSVSLISALLHFQPSRKVANALSLAENIQNRKIALSKMLKIRVPKKLGWSRYPGIPSRHPVG